MTRNLFKKRLLMDGKVYLFLDDCAEILGADVQTLYNVCDGIVSTTCGQCITEDEFNFVFNEYFPDASAVMQFTTFDTLDVKAGELIRMYPMKRMFAEDMFMMKASALGLTIDEYIESVDYPTELEKERAKMQMRYDIAEKITAYKQAIEDGIKAVSNIPFEKYGFEFQHVAVLEDGHINFKTYYVGDGVFRDVQLELMGDDVWEEAEVRDNGLFIPSADYFEGGFLLKNTTKRDFRKYSAYENVLYCLDTIPSIDEWTDYIELRCGGVNISLSKTFLMKLLNSKSCPSVYYFDGIPEIESVKYE